MRLRRLTNAHAQPRATPLPRHLVSQVPPLLGQHQRVLRASLTPFSHLTCSFSFTCLSIVIRTISDLCADNRSNHPSQLRPADPRCPAHAAQRPQTYQQSTRTPLCPWKVHRSSNLLFINNFIAMSQKYVRLSFALQRRTTSSITCCATSFFVTSALRQ
jgi:hypothetical protein